jgi:uncharacterized protein (DUF1800 family)
VLFAGPPTTTEAARFLTQASFGPTDASIAAVQAMGYDGWIKQQLAMPPSGSHLAWVDARVAESGYKNNGQFYGSFWMRAATGPDELRQRVAFALSEIFVVSLANPRVDYRGASSYYDVLTANALGNYRTLLEEVSLHPMMGVYLTYRGNQKEDPATGRNPDENYAREVMQLMSIGLHQLTPDGLPVIGADGAPVPTYAAEDVSGLAKVFTGFSWYAAVPTSFTFRSESVDQRAISVLPMLAYPAFHSTSAKSFLGVTIPAGSADAYADLRIALDTLANHPNTGPFISRQLIQRLVTSNPSPAYVGRVAGVFANNGQGVRGDLGAVVQAILLDPEARTPGGPGDGKLREPVVTMANWMRAFKARSGSGIWYAKFDGSPNSISQLPLTSPSVFNFFRPGYSPPNTRMGRNDLLAPEMQIVNEVSVAGYLRAIQLQINGVDSDIVSAYEAETALANDVPALLDRVNLLLMYGQMAPTLRARISEAVNAVASPGGTSTPAQVSAARLNRVKLAVFLTMASPEFLAQR